MNPPPPPPNKQKTKTKKTKGKKEKYGTLSKYGIKINVDFLRIESRLGIWLKTGDTEREGGRESR